MLLCDVASLIRLSITLCSRQLLLQETLVVADSLGRWRLDYNIAASAQSRRRGDTGTGRHGDEEMRRCRDTGRRGDIVSLN